MKVVLLRVGIDTGCGGIHSPLFKDGSFEFLPIPDSRGYDKRTYGNTEGRHGQPLADYFPARRRAKAATLPMHGDPEFETFTYGDPTPPKRGLRKLKPGDLLVFYAGMEGWDHVSAPALYLVGYFRIELVGFAREFTRSQLKVCSANYHVHHKQVFEEQRGGLIVIKGGPGSRLLKKAHLIGTTVVRPNGTCWQLITPKMEKVFGNFGGIGSLQRSTPRWVDDELGDKAARFVESLP